MLVLTIAKYASELCGLGDWLMAFLDCHFWQQPVWIGSGINYSSGGCTLLAIPLAASLSI
jgi:hypothetical protein